VRVGFLPPPLPASSSGRSWLSAPVVGGVAAGVVALVVLAGWRRRRAPR
jgi:hypothetical protein